MNDTAVSGIVMIAVGIVLCITVIGSPFGLIFIGIGAMALSSSKGK